MRIGTRGGKALVSVATLRRFNKIDVRGGISATKDTPRLCYLYIREQAKVAPEGDLRAYPAPIDNRGYLIFKINPQSMRFEQNVRLGIQQGRNGYVVSEGGPGEARVKLSGNFGWFLKTLPPPEEFTALPSQQLDGQQAWFALRNLVARYLNENQDLIRRGRPVRELVWFDPLHGDDNAIGLRWVVTPAAMPTLVRSTETQGVMNYELEFVQISDDIQSKKPPTRVYDLTPAPGPKFSPQKPTASPPPTPPPPSPSSGSTGNDGSFQDASPGETGSTTPLGPSTPPPIGSQFDFRFGAYATARMRYILETDPYIRYPASQHRPGREDYARGIRLCQEFVPPSPQWTSEEAKKQDIGSLLARSPIGAKWEAAVYGTGTPTPQPGKPAPTNSAFPINIMRTNVRKGLTPWGTSRETQVGPSGTGGASGAGGGTSDPRGGNAGGSSGSGGGSGAR